MPRFPALTSLTMAGLLPVWAGALGLGEAETRSALNQPLAVEIPVVAATPAEISALAVALAGPETFERYGLPVPAGLGDLNFSVTPAPGGGLIRITSTRAVVEPFVTLLLEVRWPQGRLLREYTVLLDPPAFAAGAVQQPVRVPAAPVATTQPIERAAPLPVTEAASFAGGEQAHTVASRETLWGIASRYRPDTAVDMNQTMLAIYRANPEAFAGNINRLRAGAILRIPAAGEVAAAGRSEAVAEIRRQNEAWQGGAPAQEAGRLELVPPRETPAPKPSVQAPAATAGPSPDVQAALEESRRQLAIRDAELAALRQQLAELQQKGAESGVAMAEPPPAAAAQAPAAPAEPVAATKPADARPAVRPARAPEKSWLDSIGGLFGSAWVWAALLVALAGALFFARRRSTAQASRRWSPQLSGAAAGGGLAEIPLEDEGMVVEEGARPAATGAFERRPAASRGDFEEELPFERTISTEGPVNLDQADPLAEADFHVAYGLYDQAADLLTNALAAEPGRRDLRLKLLEVYFGWENRDGFLKAARALRERVSGDTDPDWKRAVLMGKRLCPDDPLFAGAAAADAEVDIPLSGEAGIDVDVPFIEEVGDLDFDLTEAQSPQVADLGGGESTRVARPTWAAARGGAASAVAVETPAIEAISTGGTLEVPAIEARAGRPGTVEMPTIETPLGGGTVETPTMESWSPDLGGTARVEAVTALRDAAADQTEEIDLDELGLDLTGLDEAVKDISTGLQEMLPEASENLDLGLGGELESTAEMTGMESGGASPPAARPTASPQQGPVGAAGFVEETAEQPALGGAGSSQRLPIPGDEELGNLEAELGLSGDAEESQATATGLRAIRPRPAEDPTMTEVGTKLDLARAYLDMGDPDGARSILNEVLEEGDTAQRQEARQLLDTLGG